MGWEYNYRDAEQKDKSRDALAVTFLIIFLFLFITVIVVQPIEITTRIHGNGYADIPMENGELRINDIDAVVQIKMPAYMFIRNW